jgi:hypothetical protein
MASSLVRSVENVFSAPTDPDPVGAAERKVEDAAANPGSSVVIRTITDSQTNLTEHEV